MDERIELIFSELPAECRMILVRLGMFLLAVAWGGVAGQVAAAEPAAAPTAAAAVRYENPVLDHAADPHVLLVDRTYYLYPTSHTRGYDAWTSSDLVHWKHRGSVYEDSRGGVWAPDVFHDRRGSGKFYLYYTVNDPDASPGLLAKQIGVAMADRPLGPFVDQKALATGAIDAHLFQDDDGRLYLYYVKVRDGFKIFVQPMSTPLTKLGAAVEVLRPTEEWEMVSGQVTEGPFMLKHGGLYYLMYSGTGANSPNYAIGYATAKSPLGPFKKYARNPIVQRGDGIFGPGHHCVVTGPDNKLWMVYHQKYNGRINFSRFVAIDPLWFDDAGVIHARVTRGTKEIGPVPRD
jgi:xylan 1,4-beta-xylosidase